MGNFNPNDYETVGDRIRRFKKEWPDSDILTELVSADGQIGGTRWVVKASIWRKKGYERPDSTGFAFEIDGTGRANNSSALENCETSAIGRALANLNYSGDKRATREEMMKVQAVERRREQEAEARKQYVAKNSQKILDAEKAGDTETLNRVLTYFSQKNDQQLVGMVRETLERMKATNPSLEEAQATVQEVLNGELVEETAA